MNSSLASVMAARRAALQASSAPTSKPSQQQPSQRKPSTAVLKAVLASRTSGRINLSNCSLDALPASLFDPAADDGPTSHSSHSSAVAWWDVVDLTRLVAADNCLSLIDPRIADFGALTVLDLHNNAIEAVPDCLASLANLSVLNLSFNRIAALPEALCSLPLVDLQLASNCLRSLPADIGRLSRLSTLELADNQIAALPPSLSALAALQKLGLAKNHLVSIDLVSLSSLVRLTELNLSYNRIESVSASPTDPICLPALALLDIKHNKLAAWSNPLVCPQLRDACFAFNRITSINDGVLAACPLLEILDLRDNAFVAVPSDVLSMRLLKRLDLTNNNISRLQPEIGLIECINVLLVSGNPLRGLPSSGGTVRLLEYLRKRIVPVSTSPSPLPGSAPAPPAASASASSLNASMSSLSFSSFGAPSAASASASATEPAPRSKAAAASAAASSRSSPPTVLPAPSQQETASRVMDLSRLRLVAIDETVLDQFSYAPSSINLSQNQLADIPSLLQDRYARSVSSLVARQNQLVAFPMHLSFPNLKILDLSGNRISVMPETLAELPSLDDLNLSFNQLTALPRRLPFPRLTILMASDNRLVAIDAQSLRECVPGLQVLDLSNNSIASVPPELALLKSIRSLQLNGNTFRVPRPAILQRGTDAILEYLAGRIVVA
ncbi:hypothetical protein BC831DRAFT_450711 [Entophlyctis helioformis]|nr:hypothetical protein BC831DRAFT_450711 [Entophlyctis helioformis]